MVEGSPSTDSGPGPGPHNHEYNEDKNLKDNSGLLLRFSHNDGATYYNYQTPRETIPLDRSSPRRTLYLVPEYQLYQCSPKCSSFGEVSNTDTNDPCGPVPTYCSGIDYFELTVTLTCSLPFDGNSITTWTGEKDPFQTCYKYGSEDKYCYSDSYAYETHHWRYVQNIPDGVDWHSIDVRNVTSFRLALGFGVEWNSIDTMQLRLDTLASLCTTPCQHVYKKQPHPHGMCPPVHSTDFFKHYPKPMDHASHEPFQTCWKHGSEDKYCWTNSYKHEYSYFTACQPVPEEGCGPSCDDSWNAVRTEDGHPFLDSCGEPCQDSYKPLRY